MWFHRVLYVGLSKNIKTRWNSTSRPHHKLATFTGRPFVRIHWMPVAERDLENTEAVEIDKYDPPYNIRQERVKGGLRWTIIQLKDFCKDSLAIGILAFIFTVIIRLIWDYVTATPQ
jgi:excinuclease UvrABC nuclease subunit